MQNTIWVLVIQDKSGSTISAYSNERDAYRTLGGYVSRAWESVMGEIAPFLITPERRDALLEKSSASFVIREVAVDHLDDVASMMAIID